MWCCSNFRVPLPLRASHFRVPLPHGQLPFSRRPSVFTANSVSFSRPSASFSRPASLCLIYPSTLLHSHAGKLSFQIVQGKMYKNKKQVGKHGVTKGHVDTQDQDMDIRKIMKDVENFGYSHMSWKERKKIEDSKLVSLGGKPPKKQRLTLSVARPMMKKQKEREQKMLQERLILGQYGGKFGGRSKRSVEQQHKPEDRGLKSSEGRFRNGVLDVKHLLNSAPSRGHDSTETHVFRTGKKKGNKMKRGKKGAGKKRH